jgi:hypothetical protein
VTWQSHIDRIHPNLCMALNSCTSNNPREILVFHSSHLRSFSFFFLEYSLQSWCLYILVRLSHKFGSRHFEICYNDKAINNDSQFLFRLFSLFSLPWVLHVQRRYSPSSLALPVRVESWSLGLYTYQGSCSHRSSRFRVCSLSPRGE